MAERFHLSSSSTSNRRQHIMTRQFNNGSMRFAEVAGGTTAECAAVCCCCPCTLFNIIVLAVYKVPARLCQRALEKKKHRQKVIKRDAPPNQHQHPRRRCKSGEESTELHLHGLFFQTADDDDGTVAKTVEHDKAVLDLEKEMWERFYSTGFWRSPSRIDHNESEAVFPANLCDYADRRFVIAVPPTEEEEERFSPDERGE